MGSVCVCVSVSEFWFCWCVFFFGVTHLFLFLSFFCFLFCPCFFVCVRGVCDSVYALGLLLCQGNPQSADTQQVQGYALRALRFIYAIERNRKVFARLFPPELFAQFIDMV